MIEHLILLIRQVQKYGIQTEFTKCGIRKAQVLTTKHFFVKCFGISFGN